MASCPECREILPPSGLSCPECGWTRRKTKPDGERPRRAEYLRHRSEDEVCRIHRCTLSETGYCPAAEAYWAPKFACPACGGRLRDDGFCGTCTPRRQVFPGHCYVQDWTPEAGRAYGHYVLVHKGPTPAPTADDVAGYLAELRALAPKVGRAVGQVPARQPGDERLEDVEAVPF